MQRKITRVEQSLPALPVLKRVAAYARVSTAKDAMLHSLSAQVSYYSSLIQQNPEWLFSGVYCDEGLTGTKDARPGFQQMLDDCRAGKIDMVITKSISRFARNTLILLDTVRELKSLNVDVYFEEQNIHSISGDGELMLTILASYAQEESRSVSENCKWRIRERYKQGEIVSLRYLYGYRINKDGTPTERYMFSGMIRCPKCGKNYRRRICRGKASWNCSTYLSYGKDACFGKQIPEDTLLALTAEVLGTATFDQVAELIVPEPNTVIYIFKDGRQVSANWQDRSRRESWSEEMRKTAAEHAREGWKK